MPPRETRLTDSPANKVITNAGAWTPGGDALVFDTRSTPSGDRFDGTTIGRVTLSGRAEVLFRSGAGTDYPGAGCGVVTHHPARGEVAFILGPTAPERDGFTYSAARRQGVLLNTATGALSPLEARDLTFPATPGSLAGGTHVHQYHPSLPWVSFTYDDHPRDRLGTNARTVAVCELGRPVELDPARRLASPRSHSGSAYASALAAPPAQRLGGRRLLRACEEAWLAVPGGLALAFLAELDGGTEVAVATWPGPLASPPRLDPALPFAPPAAVELRLLSDFAGRGAPGVGGPRHWPRSHPGGTWVACLRVLDRAEGAKLWLVPVNGGGPRPVPHAGAVESAFTVHPDGERIAAVVSGRVRLVDVRTGRVEALTDPCDPADAPRPEACVLSPDGGLVAFVRSLATPGGRRFNQVCVVETPS